MDVSYDSGDVSIDVADVSEDIEPTDQQKVTESIEVVTDITEDIESEDKPELKETTDNIEDIPEDIILEAEVADPIDAVTDIPEDIEPEDNPELKDTTDNIEDIPEDIILEAEVADPIDAVTDIPEDIESENYPELEEADDDLKDISEDIISEEVDKKDTELEITDTPLETDKSEDEIGSSMPDPIKTESDESVLGVEDVNSLVDIVPECSDGVKQEVMMKEADDLGQSIAEDSRDLSQTALSEREQQIVHELADKGELEIYQVDVNLPEPEQDAPHLPAETGTFRGEKGNSEFIPDNSEALKLMKEYGRDSVEYKNNYPDFFPFSKHNSPWGQIDTVVEIGHMTDQRENGTWEYGRRPRGTSHDINYDLGNFAQADNALLERLKVDYPDITEKDVIEFRKSNNLTWHECEDGKTILLVPRVIHDACTHSGGVSEKKYRQAMGDIRLADIME